MADRRPRQFATRRTSANVTWVRFVTPAAITIPAASKVLLATVTLSTDFDETIRRSRGDMEIHTDQSVTQEEYSGAFGMFIASDTAVAAGAASLLGPVTDASDDAWFVWQSFHGIGQLGIATHPGDRERWDSKAMRKIVQGFTVAIMVENSSLTTGFDFAFGFSLLSSFKR